MADSAVDYAGRIMHPIWPGNTSGGAGTRCKEEEAQCPSEPDATREEQRMKAGRIIWEF